MMQRIVNDESQFWLYLHAGNSVDAAHKIDPWVEAYAEGGLRRKYAVKEMTIWLKLESLVVAVLSGETPWHVDNEMLVIHSSKDQRDALGMALTKQCVAVA